MHGHLAASSRTPKAAAAVKDLVGNESLADVSAWADVIRRERKHTAPWHYAIPKDGRLGQDYFDKNIPVVNERLSMAGVRLAALLNVVFDETKELPF